MMSATAPTIAATSTVFHQLNGRACSTSTQSATAMSTSADVVRTSRVGQVVAVPRDAVGDERGRARDEAGRDAEPQHPRDEAGDVAPRVRRQREEEAGDADGERR